MINVMTIRKQTKKWKTRERKKLRICDMGDNHLLNTIRFVERHAEHLRRYNLLFYLYTPGPSGDMAQDAFDIEFDHAMEATLEEFLPKIYYNLTKEKERRKL